MASGVLSCSDVDSAAGDSSYRLKRGGYSNSGIYGAEVCDGSSTMSRRGGSSGIHDRPGN